MRRGWVFDGETRGGVFQAVGPKTENEPLHVKRNEIKAYIIEFRRVRIRVVGAISYVLRIIIFDGRHFNRNG